jgi:hypothetical protein
LLRDSFATFALAACNSCFAITSAFALFALPTRTFLELIRFPSDVFAPVERVHGCHERIKAACRALCSSVHCLAIFNPFKIVRYPARSVSFPVTLGFYALIHIGFFVHHVLRFTVSFLYSSFWLVGANYATVILRNLQH